MTSLRPRADHQEAVSRRLALLTAELAAHRPEPAAGADDWTAGHTRIRPTGPAPPEPPPAPPLRASAVPVPGRHAARRGGRLSTLLPEPLRGRFGLGPAHLVVVAALVTVGLAVTAWWAVRAEPARVRAPSPPVSTLTGAADPLAAASPVAAEPSASAGSASGSVTVDVTGKVRRPGIVVLGAGSRVVDAVQAAGGARHGVDLSALNLARVLVDGEQIVVGGPPGAAAASGAASPGAPGAPLVNLNTATQDQLEGLPEIGPVTAQSILSWRGEHGGFTAVDELLEVDGIGDATLARITPYVTV